MRTPASCLAAALLAGCGEPAAPVAEPAQAAPSPSAAPRAANNGSAPQQVRDASAAPSLGDRPRELVNPDDPLMVFLYFDVAGVTPPLETWVENDGRVRGAPGPDKQGARVTVREELAAGAAAVQGVGRIRLSLNNANLTDYDPTYGEFTVRALAPNSVVRFSAFQQDVELKFGNGRSAQIWRVPAAEAQAIRDRVRNFATVQLDALLEIRGVQPGLGGGTLIVDILEYELREARGGSTIGRVTVTGG